MCKSGIYTITNEIKGKGYVGSSINIPSRWASHKSSLRRGKHRNTLLQNAWNKYGESAFRFDVLEEVADIAKLKQREQIWLDLCLSLVPFYNIKKQVHPDGIYTPDRIKALSERMKGNKYASGKHHTVSQQTRERIAKTLKGKKVVKSMPKGSDHALSKITEEDVLEIRDMHRNGMSPSKIALKFSMVSLSTIKSVVYNQRWRHIKPKGGSI